MGHRPNILPYEREYVACAFDVRHRSGGTGRRGRGKGKKYLRAIKAKSLPELCCASFTFCPRASADFSSRMSREREREGGGGETNTRSYDVSAIDIKSKREDGIPEETARRGASRILHCSKKSLDRDIGSRDRSRQKTSLQPRRAVGRNLRRCAAASRAPVVIQLREPTRRANTFQIRSLGHACISIL